jgi:Transglycosylase SLT domain
VVILVQFKILLAAATFTGLFWWLSAWAGRKVPVLQVQKYASPLPVMVASAAQPEQSAAAASPRSTVSDVAVASTATAAPSPISSPVATAIMPIPQVASPPPVLKPVVLQARPLAIDPVTNQILDALMSAVISQESSGNPDLQHPVSKAMGLGQVMPANIPGWTKETFGQELTTEQFKNSPDAQMYVIRQKLFEYYGRAIAASGGDLHMAVRRVGAQWYSGQSELYESTKPVATGPSIKDYTLQVLSRFQNFYPQNYLVRY